jgi:hypothetical protein
MAFNVHSRSDLKPTWKLKLPEELHQNFKNIISSIIKINDHFKKKINNNSRPNSPAFFFMEFHYLTTRASCSSLNALLIFCSSPHLCILAYNKMKDRVLKKGKRKLLLEYFGVLHTNPCSDPSLLTHDNSMDC